MRFKIFILGFIALFYVLTAQGQDTDCFLYDMNVSIPLYGSYEDEVPAVLLYQDSLQGVSYYDVQLLEDKGDRFRVHITRDIDTTSIYGWIDKKYCTVWIWLMNSNSIYLFSEPNAKSNYREIDDAELLYDQYEYGTILEFSKETSWLKLSIPTQNGYVYGWTLNYCGNIYGSCEGDRAHPPSRVYGEINR